MVSWMEENDLYILDSDKLTANLGGKVRMGRYYRYGDMSKMSNYFTRAVLYSFDMLVCLVFPMTAPQILATN